MADEGPAPSEETGTAAFVLTLRERGVRDTAVLRAMERVPRAAFAPDRLREHAHRDIALPLPCGQTMTAPSKIGIMLATLGLVPGASVFEVGTGSGWVTALLAGLGAAFVHSVERQAPLAEAASHRLGAEPNIVIETADGLDVSAFGSGRYDRILINGLIPIDPDPLAVALLPGGRLVGAIEAEGGTRLLRIDRDHAGGLTRLLGPKLSLGPLARGRTRFG